MHHYMTYTERLKLEAYLQAQKSVAWIAAQLGFTVKTIYNEIKRGSYLHNVEYNYVRRYSADRAQDITRKNQSHKGKPLKIGSDYAYANFLEHKIIKDRFSPAAALASARKAGFTTQICRTTLYSYIDNGVFFELGNRHLWIKKHRKPKSEENQRIAHPKLPCISDRPEAINKRLEFGHWEMDLIMGAKKTKPALLTLTERKTRKEIIRKIPDATQISVLNAIRKITEELDSKIKTITTDNGSEFLAYEDLKACIAGKKPVEIYYCHSYSAWEKGTVENHNRMIRRWIPKGTDITRISRKRIAQIERWMNNYPREVLGWQTPNEAHRTAASA